MNSRQLAAKMHARELASTKRELMYIANQQIQSAKSKGYETEIAPQLVRLLGVKSYRKRDIQMMNKLIKNSDKLAEYIAVVDPVTKDVVSGGQAFNRWIEYINSGIYKETGDERVYGITDVSQIPTESEITLRNFVEETEKAFLDDTVYQQFMSTLNKLMNGDTTVADDSMWQMLHPGIFITNDGKSRSASSIKHSKEHFMRDIDKYNVHDIQSAVNRLIAAEGVDSVVRRLHDAGENIIDALIVAGIGYQEQAGSAVQAVLTVLLPDETRQRAMAMGDLPDMVDDFNNEELE